MEVGGWGLEGPGRRLLDSKLGDGVEVNCGEEAKVDGVDRDLPPRLDEPELMMATQMGKT